MLRYALRRLLYLPLSLLLLSLVCFALRSLTPGDPTERIMRMAETRLADRDAAGFDRAYRRAAAELGQDRPPFYLSVYNAALPDTLHRVVRPGEQKMLRMLTLQGGNWPDVQAYYSHLKAVAYAPDDQIDPAADPRPTARRLLVQDEVDNIQALLREMPRRDISRALDSQLAEALRPTHRASLLFPAVRWNGTNNQYHRWLTGLLRGDFGVSYLDRRPVVNKLGTPLRWTLLLNGLAVFVVLIVSLPLGLYAAGYRGGRFDRWSTTTLFLLYGLPSFWIATLLANYFTTPAFGMDFFPAMGFGEVPDGADWWTALRIRSAHLFLPVMCLAYPSWAYVSRQLRSSASKEIGAAYVTTARLKGLSLHQILWGQVLRNASFPIITLLGGILPALLAGSVLIERIFNLPGMGQLLYTAAVGNDWPLVIAIVLLNGVLTAVGLLLADLAYALTDPRVRLDRPAVNPNPAA